MKIIIEAVNFVPGIDLQNFIMKKAESLNTSVQNILFIMINLCLNDECIYCNIIIDLDNDKIDVSLMESNFNTAILSAIKYARKFIKQKNRRNIRLKNSFGQVQNFHRMHWFDFSEN
mgnify:FL=1